MPKALPVGVLEAKKETEDPIKGLQQAKGYADCRRFEVKYVFATNGHLYGEFDFFTNLQDGPFLFSDFPPHSELTARYARDTGIDITKPEAAMLFQTDSPAWSLIRYYQDAAIRAAFEKIIRCRQQGEPSRVLLTLATGSGKTIIATNLLWRLGQAGQLPKPVLFLCDRDELREQAYTKLKAAFGDNQMTDFDLYDFFGHHGYKARALKRTERGNLYISGNAGWFGGMNAKAAIVLKGLGHQFSQGGTEALETPALWEVPEIKLAGGLSALKKIGQPVAVMHEAKGRLFGV
jgi:hypothetical protein